MTTRSRWCALGLGLVLSGGACNDHRLILVDGATESGASGSDDDAPPLTCGDGVVQGIEVCDGADLDGRDCESLGLGPGTLGCRPNCLDFATEGCVGSPCGNGSIEPGEVCDGSNLQGNTCESLGYPGGQLACGAGCAGFDTAGCTSNVCGNGIAEAGESCDGADLGEVSCASLGLDPGILQCRADCQDFDVLGCGDSCADSDLGSAVGPAVAMGDTSFDDDDLPQPCAFEGGADHVLRFTAPIPGVYTFDTVGSSFDTALAVFASCNPTSILECNDDFEGLQSQVTVPLDFEQPVFVSVDGFGGEQGPWRLNVTPPDFGPPPDCAELDLAWFVGSPAATGSTIGEDEDLMQSCGAGGGPDSVLRFIAPSSGNFVFDTVGSDFDTVLSIYAGCEGPELACNDDFEDLSSRVDIDLVSGQEVLVVVGGYAGSIGSWALRIFGP
ncbi:MAG: hypothetical protein AB1Z98_05305 [Nannocystaceae bacterium]